MKVYRPSPSRNSAARQSFVFLAALAAILGPGSCTNAGDWPMWRYNATRSAASPHDLPDKLQLQWTREYSRRQQVWDDPLNHDLMQYDRIFEPIVVGKQVFVGFNDSDKVVALDIETGDELWRFYTDGPVRLPLASWEDLVYFASDDGHLYCVTAKEGKLLWKFRGGPADRKVLGNMRVISMWPARGGPVIRNDNVYFAASIWPFLGTFIYSLDAETGKVNWVNDGTGAQYIKQPHSAPSFGGVAPQGALVATRSTLLVPGGRSVPAAFDLLTGEFLHFHINAGGKGTGGSFVAANEREFFVHTRRRGVRQFSLETGDKLELTMNEPVLDGDVTYSATEKTLTAMDFNKKELWSLNVDGSGDLIKAGDRWYAAGKDAIRAIVYDEDAEDDEDELKVAWTIPVDGKVVRLVAGGDRLLAVTLDGRIMALGEAEDDADSDPDPDPIREPNEPMQVASDARQAVRSTLTGIETGGGYALWYGVDDQQLLDSLVSQTQLHIVAIDPDPEKVQNMRRRYDRMGLYGKRVVAHVGDPDSFRAPPYVANLAVMGHSLAESDRAQKFIKTLYQSVRPYGGALWCLSEGAGKAELKETIDQLGLAGARIDSDRLLVVRQGALPGAAPWTHVNGNISNTVKSDDRLVKPPFGILWFGGNTNMDVLPRHTHGPPEQVIGGRLFVQGINSLTARDVYTGRTLWKREFQDLGTYEVFFDKTYTNDPLNPAYNQVHIPGANARGTNYVATEDGVYLVLENQCLLLDVNTGKTNKTFQLPEKENGQSAGRWTYVGIYEDILLAGMEFANYTKRLDGVQYNPTRRRTRAWSPDLFGSLGLVAMDRYSGEVLWRTDAQYSFLHNAIIAGNDRVYLLDKLPQSVEDQLSRRGQEPPGDYRLQCLDARTGRIQWETSDDVFGTWLGYSHRHDLLLQAGAAAPDRSPDEVGEGMIAYRGTTGDIAWKHLEREYAGPCILHNDLLITNSKSYTISSGVYNLVDGSPAMIKNPITGLDEPWQYRRAYGCNTAVASEHFLTFRSGAAGYYDLQARCGTGNLGGFRSGCSSNLIVADGILNAPDFTRTCSCGYQNQTSLGLIHMPDIETWTVAASDEFGEGRIRQLGINFGAPGDRRSTDGTLWIDYPVVGGESPPINVNVEGRKLKYFRRHTSAVSQSNLPWVAASGAIGLRGVTVGLGPAANESTTQDYRICLYFLEPEAVEAGQRVFDVAINGRSALKGIDIVAESGGRLRTLKREIRNVPLGDELELTLTAASDSTYPPVISGIELVAD